MDDGSNIMYNKERDESLTEEIVVKIIKFVNTSQIMWGYVEREETWKHRPLIGERRGGRFQVCLSYFEANECSQVQLSFSSLFKQIGELVVWL